MAALAFALPGRSPREPLPPYLGGPGAQPRSIFRMRPEHGFRTRTCGRFAQAPELRARGTCFESRWLSAGPAIVIPRCGRHVPELSLPSFGGTVRFLGGQHRGRTIVRTKGAMVRHFCLAAVLSAISGCGTLELAALGASRMKWASVGIENYRMEVRGVCFCRDREATGPFIVDLAHGEIVKATYADDGAPVPSTVFLPTVEDLFEDIRKAAISPSFRVDASYRPASRLPDLYRSPSQERHRRGLQLCSRIPACPGVRFAENGYGRGGASAPFVSRFGPVGQGGNNAVSWFFRCHGAGDILVAELASSRIGPSAS